MRVCCFVGNAEPITQIVAFGLMHIDGRDLHANRMFAFRPRLTLAAFVYAAG